MQGIKKFCKEHHIEAAFFHAIGAANEVELAWYDLGAKQYVTALFQESLEIVSLNGNVSLLDNDFVVHNHGVFSTKAMETKGGHVNKAVISGACEIVLTRVEGSMGRTHDDETGLNLLV